MEVEKSEGEGNATTPQHANIEVASSDGGNVVKPNDRESTRLASEVGLTNVEGKKKDDHAEL